MGISGKWRITEMDVWDREAIDLVGPAFIEFRGEGGEFHFIAVDGWMDCRHGQRSGRPYVDFTWEGNDECDAASGRGWAELLKDGSLTGHIYFHQGEDSGFRAIPCRLGTEREAVVPGARQDALGCAAVMQDILLTGWKFRGHRSRLGILAP